MKKIYLTRCLIVVLALGLKSVVSLGQGSASDYFRSAQSGTWDAASTWESSPDGLNNWVPAASAPTSDANTITVRSGHNIIINNSTTADQVVVAGGGILELATGSGSILTVSDGTGNDIIVQNKGIFKHNIASASSLPVFNPSSATLEIQSGGTLEAATNNGNPSNYATAANVLWADGSVFNWNNTGNPAAGVTYFPASTAIPIFRFSKPASIGGTDPTVINGLLEANNSVSLASSGKKTFRNGITGTGKVGVTSTTGSQFIINGATATLGGMGAIELSDRGLLISSGTALTLTSDKTINNYSTSNSTITNAGIVIAGDYMLSGNSKVQIDGTVKTTNVNGLSGSANTTFATTSEFSINSASSTIEYNREGRQIVTPLTYNNLIISGNGIKTAAAGADVFVSGALNIMSGCTFSLNGINDLKLNGGGILNIDTDAVFDNGGESQITGTMSPTINIYGTFITRDAQGFTGVNTSIPGITPKIFTGSTIEYGKMGNQVVTARDDYKNLTFSGSGTKAIPTCRPIGTVTIKDNAVADASNKTFGDTTATNLTMMGGRLKVAGIGTKPDIGGTYNLSGGVIEFAGGTIANKQTIRSAPAYLNIEVSGLNVGNSVSSTKISDKGSFIVKTNGVYDNNADKIDGTTGNQTFIIEEGATFKTGVKGGFSDNDSAALKNIEILIINPKSTIVYTRLGNQIITPLAAYPTLLLKGSGNKTVAAGTLTMAPTADSVEIDTSVVFKVSAGAKADFQSRPVFVRSSATSTGMIGEITDGPSALLNADSVTVERFVPARRSFRFLSPSVTTTTSIKDNWMEGAVNPGVYSISDPNPGFGTHITGKNPEANGFDPTITNNPSLFTFNPLNQQWTFVPNTNGILTAGSAYRLMVRGDRSIDMTTANNNPTPTNTILRATGTLKTGTFSPALSPVDNGYTFIGNPYASPVDFLKMIQINSSMQVTGTANNIKPEYAAWDPKLSRRGAYVTYSAVTGTNNDTSEVNQNIQAGQAFFVQTVGSNPKLEFNETYKTTGQTRVFRTPSAKTKLSVQLLLNLDGGRENVADGAAEFFDDKYNSTIGNEDSYKFTNLDENLAINRNGISLSIEGRPPVTADDTIQLKMWQFRQNNYYLRLTANHFLPGVTGSVRDAYLRKETPVDLSSATLLPFTIDTTIAASFAQDRFSIIFKAGSALPVTLTNVNAYQKGEGIQIEWTANTEININRYEVEKSADNLLFNLAASLPAKNNNAAVVNYHWFDAIPNRGNNFYRIKIIEKSGEVKYSKIVNADVSNGNNGITIFPNPIKGNILTLQLNNIEKGRYVLNLYNNLGQNMYRVTLNHTSLSATYTIVPGRAIPKGVYRLTLNKKDKTINKAVIFE